MRANALLLAAVAATGALLATFATAAPPRPSPVNAKCSPYTPQGWPRGRGRYESSIQFTPTGSGPGANLPKQGVSGAETSQGGLQAGRGQGNVSPYLFTSCTSEQESWCDRKFCYIRYITHGQIISKRNDRCLTRYTLLGLSGLDFKRCRANHPDEQLFWFLQVVTYTRDWKRVFKYGRVEISLNRPKPGPGEPKSIFGLNPNGTVTAQPSGDLRSGLNATLATPPAANPSQQGQ